MQQIYRIKFSRVPVPLNERFTVAPIDNQVGGYTNFKSKGKRRLATHRIVLTSKWRKWADVERKILSTQIKNAGKNFKTIDKPCIAVAYFVPPVNRNGQERDTDSAFKGPLDVLTQSGFIKDDCLIGDIGVHVGKPKGKGSYELFILTDVKQNKALDNLISLLKYVKENIKE